MRLHVLIHEVAVNNPLVFTDLVLETRVAAVAFRFRERKRELIEVEPGLNAADPPDARCIIEIIAGWRRPIGEIWRAGKFRGRRPGNPVPPAAATTALLS